VRLKPASVVERLPLLWRSAHLNSKFITRNASHYQRASLWAANLMLSPGGDSRDLRCELVKLRMSRRGSSTKAPSEDGSLVSRVKRRYTFDRSPALFYRFTRDSDIGKY